MEAIAPAVERGREMNDLIYRQSAIYAICHVCGLDADEEVMPDEKNSGRSV